MTGMDPFDVVRSYYRSLNRRDVDAVLALYHDACVTEQIYPDDEPGAVCVGRAAQRERLARFLAAADGALDDGTIVRPRTIGGIDTGWGWVHADWRAAVRLRSSGETRAFAGYSHFWVEDGLIRRQRSITVATSLERARDATDTPAVARQYPARPIAGVGAVIFVEGRVVLIRRRYEPLAGQWSLPGGAVELGETLEAAIAREVREETGLLVEVGQVVEVFDRILLDEARAVRFHFVLVDYLCRAVGGRLEPGSDVSDVALADPSDLAPYAITAKAAEVIAKAAEMR